MQKAFYENLIKGSMKPVPNPLRLQTKVHQIDKDKCRSIKIGDKSLKFPNNGIKTSRYSILSWIPKSLLFQFRRAANVYFLIIAILTAMPFSPKNPVSMTVTFLAVLIFTMFKEGYEDLKRHR